MRVNETYALVFMKKSLFDDNDHIQCAVSSGHGAFRRMHCRAAAPAPRRGDRPDHERPPPERAQPGRVRLFYKKMLSPEKAVKTLKQLMRKFPDNEIIPYVLCGEIPAPHRTARLINRRDRPEGAWLPGTPWRGGSACRSPGDSFWPFPSTRPSCTPGRCAGALRASSRDRVFS